MPRPPESKRFRPGAVLRATGLGILLLPCLIWCAGVWYYCPPWPGPWVRMAAVLAFPVLALMLIAWNRALIAVILIALTMGYFASIRPSADRDWQTPWKRIVVPETLPDKRFLLRNVRDFQYRTETDFDERYAQCVIDPKLLESVDVALSYWDGLELVAHSMLCFNFSDGQQIVVSPETRKAKGVSDDLTAGIYKQYELIYVIGTARDLFGLRVNFRGEDLYLYRTGATPREGRILLNDLVRRAVALNTSPQFYHTIWRNCSTSLLPSLALIRPNFPFNDGRILKNGLSPQLLYEVEYLNNPRHLSFDALKKEALQQRGEPIAPRNL